MDRLLAGWRRAATRLLGSSRMIKRSLVALLDMASCVLAVWISFMIRLGIWVWASPPLTVFVLFELVCVGAVFLASGVYNNVFRFHGAHGLGQIARCCLLIGAISVVVFGFISIPGVPRTVSVLFPLVFFALVALNRIVARFLLVDMVRPPSPQRRVLIYGSGTPGRQLAVSLHHEPGYRLIAYVDDDPDLVGQKTEGIPILSSAEMDGLLAAGEVDLVLLAAPALSRSQRAAVVERLQRHEVHVQTLPGVHEIVAGKVSVSDLREIEITDLLARDPVQADERLMGAAITGKTVLVTGAGGSIGSELCRQIVRQRPARLVLFEMTEATLFDIDNELRDIASGLGIDTEIVSELGSLVNMATVDRLFSRWRPHTVFHAAAYKHVPMVETNPLAGVQNNVFSTLHCALAACVTEVERFILVSTDKAVRPTNVMGASKRVCELILQSLADQPDVVPVFAMVRFGNVLGSSGSVVPHFQRQIAMGGPVTVTNRNVTRYFMTIPEAAELVIQAGAMASGGEVYLLDMGEPVKIYDLARTMITMSGRTIRDEDNPDGDIAIVEIGLRPGEKLYEELLISAEATRTEHERIFRAREESIEWPRLVAALEEMRKPVDRGDEATIRHLLSKLVSGYSASAPLEGDAAIPQGFLEQSPVRQRTGTDCQP